MGVYSAVPSSNNITANININAANAQVGIRYKIDDGEYSDEILSRSGKVISIPNIYFNENIYNKALDIPEKVITFKIKNYSSTVSLGAFFSTTSDL